jgi:hypothetical protein
LLALTALSALLALLLAVDFAEGVRIDQVWFDAAECGAVVDVDAYVKIDWANGSALV